jgi:alkanesulfonate monooxygenase SsuD/methylene tetrahydromethanopterin reductase-like flavin-dependent oxidoreductase (luciferase family)
VAKYADQWNAMGSVEKLAHKVEVLERHCDDVGRDIAEIEMTAGCKPIIRSRAEDADALWRSQMAANRTPMEDVLDDDTFWVGPPELIAERMSERKALGFHTFLAEMAAPYDDETLDRWINEVVPMVEGR